MTPEELKKMAYADEDPNLGIYLKAICHKCGKIFPLDYNTMRISYCRYSNDAEIKIKCPYCGDLYTQ